MCSPNLLTSIVQCGSIPDSGGNIFRRWPATTFRKPTGADLDARADPPRPLQKPLVPSRACIVPNPPDRAGIGRMCCFLPRKPGPKFTKELVDACLNQRAEPPIGLRREELPVMVSRVFGFKSTSPKVKELVEKTLLSMHEAGDVVSRDEPSFLPDRTRMACRFLGPDLPSRVLSVAASWRRP